MLQGLLWVQVLSASTKEAKYRHQNRNSSNPLSVPTDELIYGFWRTCYRFPNFCPSWNYFLLVYPLYWLCLSHLQVASCIKPHLEGKLKLSEVKWIFPLLSTTYGTCSHGYVVVVSMQLLISLTAKYKVWMNSHWWLWGQLHRPSTPMAANCATNAAKC